MEPNRDSKQRYLTVKDVAMVLGRSPSSVRWLLQTNKIASIRPARRRLVPAEALDRFIAGGVDDDW